MHEDPKLLLTGANKLGRWMRRGNGSYILPVGTEVDSPLAPSDAAATARRRRLRKSGAQPGAPVPRRRKEQETTQL